MHNRKFLVLKVYSIESDTFTEVHNMRHQQNNNKNHNLSFSSNAIDWSKIDTVSLRLIDGFLCRFFERFFFHDKKFNFITKLSFFKYIMRAL